MHSTLLGLQNHLPEVLQETTALLRTNGTGVNLQLLTPSTVISFRTLFEQDEVAFWVDMQGWLYYKMQSVYSNPIHYPLSFGCHSVSR